MKERKYLLLGLLSVILIGTVVFAGDIEMKINGATDAVTIDKSDGTEAMRVTADGKVGIGTTAPSVKLDVAGDIKTNGIIKVNGVIQINRGNGDVSTASDLWIAGQGLIAAENNLFFNTDSNGDGSGEFRFVSGTETSAATRLMTIKHDGKVGIGTTAPTSTLHVAGDIRVTGCPDDMEEWAGYCMEKTDNAAANRRTALSTCGAKGRQLCDFDVFYECDVNNGANCAWTDAGASEIRWVKGNCASNIANTSFHTNFCAVRGDNIILPSNQAVSYKYRCCKPLL